MFLYGVTMMPLFQRACYHVEAALQTWYADDLGSAGRACNNPAMFEYVVQHGLRYRYLPELAKSWYVCKGEDKAITRAEFERQGLHNVQLTWDHQYLGGFLGSGAFKKEWVQSLIQVWTCSVETLADIKMVHTVCLHLFCLLPPVQVG